MILYYKRGVNELDTEEDIEKASEQIMRNTRVPK
jgi:hypothetical protein